MGATVTCDRSCSSTISPCSAVVERSMNRAALILTGVYRTILKSSLSRLGCWVTYRANTSRYEGTIHGFLRHHSQMFTLVPMDEKGRASRYAAPRYRLA